MYLIGINEELTIDKLGLILTKFQSGERPILERYWNYYQGMQKISNKRPTDVGRPCNKSCVNYIYSITQNYLGYMSGIPIKYANDNFDEILNILNYNDVNNEDTELLRQALIFGRSFEINYIDEESKQRFKVLDSRECIPVYYNNLNNDLAYVIRFYMQDLTDGAVNIQNYIVEVYGAKETKYYKSSAGFASFELIDEQPNFFNQVPVTVFSLNQDELPIFDKIIDLQDAYNEVFNASVDNILDWANAYLILKGVTADADDLRDAKEKRAFCVDSEADISYLTKTTSDADIQNVLKLTNDHIHSIANSPDFTDKDFMSQSGVAIRYKLIGFENTASAIESYMRKALTKRIELIASVLQLTSDEIFADVKITFTRNLPISLDPTNANELMAYKGTVSDETLLEQIPFVNDVQEELLRVQNQKMTNMELYMLNGNQFNNEEDTEDEQ